MEKKKKKKVNLDTPVVVENGKILKFGKVKKQKEIEDIIVKSTKNESKQAIYNFKTTLTFLDAAAIDIEKSKPYQYRQNTESNINNLLLSINQDGILTPLSVCKSDEPEKHILLEGFSRYKSLLLLSDAKKMEEKNIVPTRDFLKYQIPVLIYENEDGTILSEEQRSAISVTQNNKRANWNAKDLVMFYFDKFKQTIYRTVAEKKSNSESAKKYLDIVFKEKNFKLILNLLKFYELLSENEIALIKENLLTELTETTNLKREEIIIILKLIGLDEKYWKIINGEDNPYGLQIPIKYAINLFLNKKSELLTEENIEKKLLAIQKRVNPLKRGMEIVKPKDLKDEKKDSRLKKEIKEMVILTIEGAMSEAKKKSITAEEFIAVLNAFNICNNKKDLLEEVSKKLKIELPELE